MQRFLPLAIALSLVAAAVSTAAADQTSLPSGGWQIRAPLPLDLFGGAMTAAYADAYIAGGYSYSTGQTMTSFYKFSPATNTWSTLAPFPGPGAYMASAVYHPTTDRIYVFGGADQVTGTNYDTTRIYDPVTNSWTIGTPLPDVRSFMASGYNPGNNCIYLVGGYRTGEVTSAQDQVWELCPPSGTWTSKAPIPHAVGGTAFWIFGGHMYVAGGRDAANQVLDLCWDYNIAADVWSACENLPYPINVPGSATCPARRELGTCERRSSRRRRSSAPSRATPGSSSWTSRRRR